MARKPTGKPNGRPPKDINKQEFEKLCGLQCTLEEIAGWFNCSEDTIQRWVQKEYGETFAVIYKKHSGKGKISLRRNQMQIAKTNATMAIWLGKQYLGQRENQETMNKQDNEDVKIEVRFKNYNGKESKN